MTNFIDGACGAVACLLTGSLLDKLPATISVICTCSVAVVTCFVQLYRLWRDRDKDIKSKKDKNEGDNDNV